MYNANSVKYIWYIIANYSFLYLNSKLQYSCTEHSTYSIAVHTFECLLNGRDMCSFSSSIHSYDCCCYYLAHSVNFRLCYITYYVYTLKLLMAIRTFHAYTYQCAMNTTTYECTHWLVLCLMVCSMWVLSEFLSAKLYEPTRTSADDFRTLRCAVIDLHSLNEHAHALHKSPLVLCIPFSCLLNNVPYTFGKYFNSDR